MERYKNFVKIEEIRELLRQGRNEEALELADGMDSSKIKDNFDRSVLAQVYLHNGMLGRAKDCFILMYEKRKTRRVAMELVNLSIRLKQADDAEKYFNEYKALAPNDYYNLIFRYKIDRLNNRPLEELAVSLEKLREVEFFDNWGYELAKVYHKLGNTEKCVEICDEVILWFGDGEYVERAKALKAFYAGEITLKQMSEKTKAESEKTIEPVQSSDIVVPRPERKTQQKPEDIEAAENLGETRVAAGGWITKEALAAAEAAKRAAEAEKYGTGADTDVAETEETVTGADTDVAETEETVTGADTDMAETEETVTGADIDVAEAEEYGADIDVPEESGTGAEGPELNAGIAEPEEIRNEDTAGTPEASNASGPVWDGNSEFVIGGEASSDEDNFDAEIVKAVEEALKEETAIANHDIVEIQSDEKSSLEKAVPVVEVSEEPVKKQEEADKVQDEETETVPDGQKPVTEAVEWKDKPEGDSSSEDTLNSALMAAVEEELGFVENTSKEPEDRKSRKKRHTEKKQERRAREAQAALLKKQKEEQALLEQKQREEEAALAQKKIEEEQEEEKQEAIRQAELRRAKQEAADAAARRARERMGMEAPENPTLAGMVDEIIEEDKMESLQKSSPSKGSDIHKQKKLEPVEVPAGTVLADILKKDSCTLEEYFGFFAYRQEICSQLIAALEALLKPENKGMNYCIIGEKGAGKKVLIQGITRLLYRAGKLETKQAVWTDASKLNGTKLSLLTAKLSGRCLVIERAGGISEVTADDLLACKKHYAGHTSVVLTDYRKNLMDLLKDDMLNDMFSIRLNLPSFSRDNLMELAEYKTSKADFVFSNDAYELLEKRITCISRATEEGALARAEKYIMRILDNVEQRNAKEYIRQTMQGSDHVRSNVIEPADLPEDI